MAARHDGAAEADRRRGAGRRAGREALLVAPPHRQRRADAGRPRRLVARGRRGRLRRPGVVPVRADGRRGPALPDVHERARPRSRRGSRTRPPATSSASRRRTTTSSTSSPTPTCTGARPTSAGSPATATSSTARSATARPSVMYEGTPDFPDKDRWWEIVERYGVDDPLHGADRDPRAHEVGARARGEARPLVAAPARLGRRADQPRGVGLVPRAHRRRPHADRRHVVADRDRDDPDHAAAGRDDAEAGLGDEAVPGRRGRGLRRAGERGRPGRRRLPRAAAAVAGDAARDLQATTSATATRTGRSTRTCTSPATARGSTRTATSGCSAASTT